MSDIRFYLDEVSVKKLFADLKEAREENARLKAEQCVTRYTMAEIRKELGWTHVPSDKELREEDFSDEGRVCNWRKYVNKNQWYNMSDLQRLVAFVMAKRQADAEEWD